mgnify:CR=1 FL=1
MNNNEFSPNAISHRELKCFLTKAKKEFLSKESFNNNNLNGSQEFDDLITESKSTSQKILLMLNNKDKILNVLWLWGAMGAHISMALQALKATEFDQ